MNTSGFLSSRSAWLDALRATAIALVLLRHGVVIAETGPPPSEWLIPAFNLASNGWLGVDVFFVLSGFLLSHQILQDSQLDRFRMRQFLIRRIMRIGPAYLAVLLILWCGLFQNTLNTEGTGEPLVLLMHLLFLQDYFSPIVLVTFWSLATEEKFYLLMAFFVPLLARLRAPLACGVLAGVIAIVVGWRTLSVVSASIGDYDAYFWNFRAPFHFAIDGLLLGVMGGFITTRWRQWSGIRTRTASALAATLVLLLCAARWAQPGQPGLAAVAVPLVSLIVLGLILATPCMDRLLRDVHLQPIQFLARISFSVYLVHYPVAQVLHASLGDGVDYWLAYPAMAIGTGWMLYRAVELPGMKLRHMITRNQPDTATIQRRAKAGRAGLPPETA